MLRRAQKKLIELPLRDCGGQTKYIFFLAFNECRYASMNRLISCFQSREAGGGCLVTLGSSRTGMKVNLIEES